mmetsp:Transcript_16423/g.27835  ORF Transcript_16423/g.27835 Transcript_16423/m.27835 type:complete len:89 (+) Transcript_16423:689-955(+)
MISVAGKPQKMTKVQKQFFKERILGYQRSYIQDPEEQEDDEEETANSTVASSPALPSPKSQKSTEEAKQPALPKKKPKKVNPLKKHLS